MTEVATQSTDKAPSTPSQGPSPSNGEGGSPPIHGSPTAPNLPAAPPVTSPAPLTQPSQLTGVAELMRVVLVDPKLSANEKQMLIDELRKESGTDRWTYRYAILFLGAAVLCSIILLGLLAWGGLHAPDGLIALGSAALGGLAGLLAPGRRGDDPG